MSARKKRRRRCQSCKQLKHDVRTQPDPFQQDVHNKEVLRALCTECRQQLLFDI